MQHGKTMTWVAVADGAKALVFENLGTELEPALHVLRKEELDNPPTREQGTDRPGRRPDTGIGQRSAMEETDWHDIAEERFLRAFAERLNRAAEAGRVARLVLIAPPRALGVLREALAGPAAGIVAAEIDKDLTNQPVDKIESQVSRALKPGRT